MDSFVGLGSEWMNKYVSNDTTAYVVNYIFKFISSLKQAHNNLLYYKIYTPL